MTSHTSFPQTPSRNAPSLQVSSTPHSAKLSGTREFSSRGLNRSDLNPDLAREMSRHFLRMSPRTFLDTFMQTESVPSKTTPWAKVAEAAETSEAAMYAPFVKAANNLVTNLKFVATDSKGDLSCDELKPDISVYRSEDGNIKNTDFSRLEFFVEMKSGSKPYDPFDDEGPIEHNSDDAKGIRGQLGSYAAALAGSQFRVHVFSILMWGTRARLMRWDRSGAVVSEGFEYAETTLLYEFIWRYSRLTPSARGHDPSVTVAPFNGDAAPRLRKDNLRHREYRRMRIHERDAPTNELRDDSGGREYVISYPHAYIARSPFGRATRGMLGYDESLQKYVFIKDYWRTIATGMEKEGEIYRTLEKHKVRHIATFAHGNDFSNHTTLTNTLPGGESLKKLQHYRIALSKVGRKLTSFGSTRELVSVIADAMEAHDDAYFKARIFHRDISAGNIMIADNGEGFLIDWDLCIRMDGGNQAPRQSYRTGTWQFMSAKLLDDTEYQQCLEDDRESAFHVLRWTALRYTTHNKLEDLEAYLRPYEEKYNVGGKVAGGNLKGYMMTQESDKVKFQDPLNSLIQALRKAFAWRYVSEPTPDDFDTLDYMQTTAPDRARTLPAYKYQQSTLNLKEQKWLVTTLRNHTWLNEWKLDDEAKQNGGPVSADGVGRKRKHGNGGAGSKSSKSRKLSRSAQELEH